MINKRSKESFIAFKEALKFKFRLSSLYYNDVSAHTHARTRTFLILDLQTYEYVVTKCDLVTGEIAGSCGRITVMSLWMWAILIR